MKFKSQIVTAVSGSVGGITYAHNQGGLYMRGRSTPTNPQSAQQVAIRNAVTTLSNAWGSVLTSTQRTGWATYAANVPIADVFGDSRLRSAQQMFIRSNVSRLQAGFDYIEDAPVVFNLGDFTAPTFSTTDAGALGVTFGDADDWVDEDDSAMLVYASRPQSASIEFFKGPYRLAGTIDGDATTAPTSPATLTSPFPLSAGQKQFYMVRVTRADGRLSGLVRASTTVTAM